MVLIYLYETPTRARVLARWGTPGQNPPCWWCRNAGGGGADRLDHVLRCDAFWGCVARIFPETWQVGAMDGRARIRTILGLEGSPLVAARVAYGLQMATWWGSKKGWDGAAEHYFRRGVAQAVV
jgi:hypothetical protein